MKEKNLKEVKNWVSELYGYCLEGWNFTVDSFSIWTENRGFNEIQRMHSEKGSRSFEPFIGRKAALEKYFSLLESRGYDSFYHSQNCSVLVPLEAETKTKPVQVFARVALKGHINRNNIEDYFGTTYAYQAYIVGKTVYYVEGQEEPPKEKGISYVYRTNKSTRNGKLYYINYPNMFDFHSLYLHRPLLDEYDSLDGAYPLEDCWLFFRDKLHKVTGAVFKRLREDGEIIYCLKGSVDEYLGYMLEDIGFNGENAKVLYDNRGRGGFLLIGANYYENKFQAFFSSKEDLENILRKL